uniref:RRM domain-containing protein n=1 Tax=Dendroctonus ponderosae TaxID=77166 RepID=A0AAR5P9C8_DENPD
MVRKTTRAAALKASEKNRRESPRRSRRRKSSSKSESSEDEVLAKVKQAQLSNASEKGSSDNETDRESKKPLKKRTRSMVVNEAKQKLVVESEIKSAEKEIKIEEPRIEEEEVNVGDNAKGKSKCINKSNIVNDNAETENANVQVTEESPILTKDDNTQNDDRSKNGTDPSEIDVNISQTLVAEMTCENQATEITTDETTEVVISEHPVSESCNEEDSKDLTQVIVEQCQDAPKNDEKSSEERINTPDIPPATIADSTSDIAETEVVQASKPELPEATKKIRLHRMSKDERISVSESSSKPDKKEDSKKKIVLKRPEIKAIIAKEEKEEESNNDSSSPIEQPPGNDWGSGYEASAVEIPENPVIKSEEKVTRRKITLKRSAVEDGSKPDLKEHVVLTRSTSLSESKERRTSTSDNIVINERQRKLSVVVEKAPSEVENKPEKPLKPRRVVKLIRKLPERLEDPLPSSDESLKRSNWGQPDISHLKVDNVLLLDSLREICPTIELLDEADVDLEISEPKSTEKSNRKTFKELEEEEMENIEAELNAEPEEADMETIIATNRNFSIVEDSVSKLKPPPSPPRNPVSEVLFITNLVRPFTVKQLKELLERTGKLKEDGFWTDKIKSKCFACYETAEEAEVTRNALHGVHWPIGNGKKLIIDYSTMEDMETAKNPPVVIFRKEKTPEIENHKPALQENVEEKKDERPLKREWDIGKDHRKMSRSRSKEGRERKHSRRSFTPEEHHKKRSREEPVPQKAMDDLFLKTQATPSIYWQPLSPEEIAHKQQLRQARLEENKRRLEKIRSSGRGGVRDRGGRDRIFRRR